MDDPGQGVDTRTKWMRFGMAIAVLHYVFLAAILVLLQIDLYVALIVAIVVGTVAGIAITVFVLYIY